MVYKKETPVEAEVRKHKIRLETIVDEYDLPIERRKWSVSNLMWMNHNLPKLMRGRANLKEHHMFIVEMLRNRRRLNIP